MIVPFTDQNIDAYGTLGCVLCGGTMHSVAYDYNDILRVRFECEDGPHARSISLPVDPQMGALV